MADISDFEIISFNQKEMHRYVDSLLSCVSAHDIVEYSGLTTALQYGISGTSLPDKNGSDRVKETTVGIYDLGALLGKLPDYELPLKQTMEYLDTRIKDIILDAHLADDWKGQGNPNQ